MPHINRVRVNNVKYNFGTQYYDDFVMRFNGRNTIYDLANGGGKSLLMLLILQNLIPNCTLDEKQPIEKLFRGNGGNTTIHSLVEWKLDPCYMKENFKYMTTGFCARKGRSGSGEESENQGTAAGYGTADNASSRDSASVEYFNYVIFYREFGDNDIRNLPLSNGSDRITYNGFKTYLRELEKKDFGVSVKIFERKGDYQKFISEYGLYESEWEIVCGINKTEGHVRTYFETNYKTSRKVVEDLLIEEIIQKSFNNKLGVENDEGEMARTLLDIKDKLVELSKKHSEMSGYDEQVLALNVFSKQLVAFEEMYTKKEELKKQLYDMLIACKRNLNGSQNKHDALIGKLAHMQEEMSAEQRLISTAQVLGEQKSLEEIRLLLDETVSRKEKAVELTKDMRMKLLNKESANDYRDYLEYTKQYDEIRETIDNRLRDHEDVINELKVMALVKFEKNRIELAKLEDGIADAANGLKTAEDRLSELDTSERNSDRQAAVLESKAAVLEKEISKDEAAIRKLMDGGLILVAENASTAIEETRGTLCRLNSEVEELSADCDDYAVKIENYRNRINKAEAAIEVISEELKDLEHNSEREDSEQKRYESLARVYNENDSKALLNIIIGIYKKDSREADEIEGRLKSLREYEANLMEGRYVFNGEQYLQVKEYLLRHYGEDVVDGQTWYKGLNPGQKRDVSKRAPFVRYGFIILNDFERIKMDTTLQSFNQSSYIVPILSENILIDMKLEVNSEMVRFAAKDLEFLNDDAKVEAELKTVREEIENLENKISKLSDRMELIWEDYGFVLCYADKSGHLRDTQGSRLEKAKAQIGKLNDEKSVLTENRQKLDARYAEKKAELRATGDTIRKLEGNISDLKKIMELNDIIQVKYAELANDRKNAKEAVAAFTFAKSQLEEAREEVNAGKMKLAVLSEEKSRMDSDWKNIYLPYYSENADIKNAGEYSSLSNDQLESRFLGLRAVIEKETADIKDKEALMNTYRASIQKCRNNIEYRELDFAEVVRLYEAKEIYPAAPEELVEIKAVLKQQDAQMAVFDREIEAQSALMNRIEGSIEHGRNQIAEKYGSFEEFACDNPQMFVEQHKALVKKLHESIREMESRIKSADGKVKEVLLIEKDLERIVKNAGLIIPQNLDIYDDSDMESMESAEISADDYERVQKEFEALTKSEYRKKEEFQKQKVILADKLNKLKAYDLANEVTNSVNVPETSEKARELMENIEETNTFILLEKDRIAKGIEDMERIKDNFENRCIQTCINIRTELDRLPGLSKITLDDESISIISLQIPYVKEEFFKDRMSSYVNETVTGAESFKNPEDRLKYIRTRLTWKKLFSVIVTDMNAIRINLYKRERIKDQSRYLKYEEAVGSTGQSQGIYIQFLIAIINYISSINATSHENSSLGKVIFIDNPFGAAKDIYIWEPIFKLLKTNHVQLIVPARGATPAITGRFEVNYILGQKLVDGKQQTVIVDYHSQIKGEEIEYTTMDFEQTSLFDIV